MSVKSLSRSVAVAAACVGAAWSVAVAQADSRPATGPSPVERGAYLVKAGACADCHTPWKLGPSGPEPDESRGLSGHPEGLVLPAPPQPQGPWIMATAATNTAWAGPWGVSYTANLTPDAETGIGNWTERQFVETLRSGRHLGRGRAILPPMPWPALSHLNDEDLGAIFAYLRSRPAVKNRVPEPLPPADGQR